MVAVSVVDEKWHGGNIQSNIRAYTYVYVVCVGVWGGVEGEGCGWEVWGGCGRCGWCGRVGWEGEEGG